MTATYTTLISCAELRALQGTSPALVLLDCCFDLADPTAGERAFAAAHLPTAQYAHLDRDLAGTKNGSNGRHPLPGRREFAATAARWGITPSSQVVTFDGQGLPYAARAWWLLRWLGHSAVAVLDGGTAAWLADGGKLTAELPVINPAPPYPEQAAAMPTIDANALLRSLGNVRLIDARAAERFRGDVEPLDPVAGHIPGASQRFFKDNLAPDGRFKPAAELRGVFEALSAPGGQVVHQCGSGVTACHNLLAMTHAGLEGALLYPGSWSEWCADPARPVARG